MSKAVESFFETVLNAVYFAAIIYVVHGAWNSDWDLRNFFDKPVKKEVWITAERSLGTYTAVLDEKWASSIFNHTEAKIKLRDTIAADSSNGDKLDVAYEIKAKLMHPLLSKERPNSKVSYKIFFTFKFIDDDGFIIHSFDAAWFSPLCEHEKFKNATYLHYDWDGAEGDMTIKGLLSRPILEKIANKVKKVTYIPRIVAEVSQKKKSGESEDILEKYGWEPADD